MLFKEKELKSNYDFGQVLEKDSDSDSLVKEIMNKTSMLYSMWKENKIVNLHHKDNNDKKIVVDLNLVSDSTWNRSFNEIKEILVRKELNGQDQEQFSICKALKKFNVYMPSQINEDITYLQILYFFYMMNYFIFPNVNIFKKFSKENINYLNAYDEGTSNGIYCHFIISNILDNEIVFRWFYEYCFMTSYFQDRYCIAVKELFENCKDNDELYHHLYTKIENLQLNESNYNQKVYSIFECADYMHGYTMLAYCLDVLNNLDEAYFYFDELELPPFENWKNRYIDVEKIDDFLEENQLYWFCKQKIEKIESRDRIKFLNSKAIQFLKDFIEYDMQPTDYYSDYRKGSFIEIKDGVAQIYALRIAIIIKTYNDLTNLLKVKIKSGKKQELHPLKTSLSIKSTKGVFFPTLVIRLFMLACHSQYLNATCNHEIYFERFKKEFLYPERIFLETMCKVYEFPNHLQWDDAIVDCIMEIVICNEL